MSSSLFIRAKDFYEEVVASNNLQVPPSKVIDHLAYQFREVLENFEDKLIMLDTYGNYDEEKDIQYVIRFTVPVVWVQKKLKTQLEVRGINFQEFMQIYTWDDTEDLYHAAENEGVILEWEELER